MVDVLEGICTQTHAVVYKALRERLRPCLVLNKIDRLAVEMRLSTVEAFHHLRRLVENVNVTHTSLNTSLKWIKYIYECISTYIHTAHTYIHKLIFTECIHIQHTVHTYCTCIYIYNIHIHSFIHTYSYIYNKHIHIHSYIHTYIHTYIHRVHSTTFIHTYIHT